MNVPSFEYSNITNKDGSMTAVWIHWFEQLISQLIANFGTEGLVVPSLSTADIALIASTLVNGTIIYDSTLDEFKGQVGGTLKTFTLT